MPREDLTYLNAEPVVCRQPCGAVLNPFCQILNGRGWLCSVCGQTNPLPSQYQSEMPLQCLEENSTIEYITSRRTQPPIFLFVMDVCLTEDDFQALRESLLVSLNLIPEDAFVGFISFGKHVMVHELADDGIRAHVFNGSKEYTHEEISKKLGFLTPEFRSANPASQQTAMKYIQNAAMAEYSLDNILETIKEDSWPRTSKERAYRATGCALNVASTLLKSAFPHVGSHIMLFTGGPCTHGPGMIVGNQLKEPIRSHHLIEAKEAKHFKKAKQFYTELTKKCSENGTSVDLFIGAYDQVGLYEMEELCDHTGGVVVLTDSFTTSIFKQSFQRFFTTDQFDQLAMGHNATLEVKTSKHVKVAGLLGHAQSLAKNDQFVSTNAEYGISKTSAWKLSGIRPNSTYGFVFDTTESQERAVFTNAEFVTIQFITFYEHPDTSSRLRVTTVTRPLSQQQDLSSSFDQEAAAVLIGRIAVDKVLKDDVADVIAYVDKILLNLFKTFGEFRKNDPGSFRIGNNFSLFPQFIYHLRRSQFLQVFNNSPDETVFYRHVFNTEDTSNSLIMIQPTLTAYEQTDDEEESEEGIPVLLDSLSIQPTRILLLDTFFHILIYHGATIASWRREGYQDDPEYASFKEFLNAPRIEAAELLTDRFPLPRFIDTEEGGSQARFLYSKLNPTTTHSNQGFLTQGGGVVLTDDVSLQTFMEHVSKLVVESA